MPCPSRTVQPWCCQRIAATSLILVALNTRSSLWRLLCLHNLIAILNTSILQPAGVSSDAVLPKPFSCLKTSFCSSGGTTTHTYNIGNSIKLPGQASLCQNNQEYRAWSRWWSPGAEGGTADEWNGAERLHETVMVRHTPDT